MSPKVPTSRWARPLSVTAATAAALACWVEVGRLSLFKRYGIDEFQYAHAAWLISRKMIPHRDFFEFHFPLPYLTYSFFINDNPASILRLRVFMLCVFALTSYAIYRINRHMGRWLALAGPLAAATSVPFVFFATEIRPDALAFGLFVAALSLLFPVPVGRLRAAVAGALLVLSMFASQKALIYSAPLVVVLLMNLVRKRQSTRWIEAPKYLVLGASGVVLGIAGYFVITHSGAAWFEQTLRWAAYHERHYPGFSWRVYLGPALRSAPILFVLGLLGVVHASMALKRLRAPQVEPDLVLILSLAGAFYSFYFARAPYPYALLPALGMLCVFAPRGLGAALEGVRRLPVSPILRWLASSILVLVLLAFGPVSGFLEAQRKLVPDNGYQKSVLADIARVTKVTDPIYDNSGGYVARPHVGFRYYTSALDRQVEATELPIVVPRSIRDAECTAMLLDLRFFDLPSKLRRFLLEHFQPYNADLWLWGQSYSGSEASFSFEAVRPADYFVEPEVVAKSGAFAVDGALVSSAILHLSRGTHLIKYTGAVRPFFILWLPADKQVYRPSYGLTPEYSRG